ncbi:hypothetical protein M514_21303 [Trichuris suis]|uniref:Uncharacterized protein n=1 Tax=Trichuris suis TaxID=68888 RepID=A0A085NAG3_9BILA|nr:hypothetical protein M514_21303 [Trichuris suis]
MIIVIILSTAETGGGTRIAFVALRKSAAHIFLKSECTPTVRKCEFYEKDIYGTYEAFKDNQVEQIL